MCRHYTLLLLFLFVPLFSVPAQERSMPTDPLSFIDEPNEKNTYYLTDNDGWGHVPKGWKRQQKLLKKTKDSDLEILALHSDSPAIRAMAFRTLAIKHSPKCYDILLAELTDANAIWVASYDVWFPVYVSSFEMEAANSDSLLFSAEQRHRIDSVVVFGPGLQHLCKLTSASRLRGMDGLSERLRTLYLDGESYLLPLIVEGKNEADIPLVISALRDYKMGLDEQGLTNYALIALMKWQNEAFLPVLEELRDYELSRRDVDYHRVKLLFKVVMAYDNGWAYHFIEDTFDNKGAKNKFSYPENLYRAYYEENGPSRFLPLIDKYGKKPFDWELE